MVKSKMKEWQRQDVAKGKFLLRHTEHFNTIKDIIEQEYPTWSPLSVAGMTTSIPGGDEYIILFQRTEDTDE